MRRQRILLLGGTGFVGRHLAWRLARDEHSVCVPSRNRDRQRAFRVVPGIEVVNADVHDRAALTRLLGGCDAVVNLVGILNERGSDGRGFRRVHVELVQTLVDACHAAGVPRLLQMSALGVDFGSSHYLQSRREAEAILRASDRAWTIFRPSVIFGDGDGLYFRFARLLRWLPVLPLARAAARLQPVWVDDVAEAIARALMHPHSVGHTYELGGPEVMRLIDIVRSTASMLGLRRLVVPLPDPLGRLQARFGEWLPGKPFSRDNFRSLEIDSVIDDDGLAALGIVPMPSAAVMPRLLAVDARGASGRRGT